MSKRPKRIRKQPWYAEGLRFECQPDCGACCTNHSDYAYVYLERDDLPDLAKLLGMTEAAFTQEYTDTEDGWVFLKMEAEDCMFLEGNKCGVYQARPVQCRTFPFWKESLKSRKTWEKLCEFCPGIDRGPVHNLLQIQKRLDERD